MSTRFKTAAEAAAALAQNPDVKGRVESEVASGAFVSALLSWRIAKGKTQEEVAAAMGCDPSKISRLESGDDADLKWRDIAGYLSALGIGLSIILEDPSMPAAQRIKSCVFKIYNDLEKLAALAKDLGGDDEISRKIHEFYGEVLFDFVVKYKDSYDKICSIVKVTPPTPQKALPAENAKTEKVEAAQPATVEVVGK